MRNEKGKENECKKIRANGRMDGRRGMFASQVVGVVESKWIHKYTEKTCNNDDSDNDNNNSKRNDNGTFDVRAWEYQWIFSSKH